MQKPISVRVPEELKSDAKEVLEAIGLSPSTAVRLFLTQVVKQKGIPFELVGDRESHIQVQPEGRG